MADITVNSKKGQFGNVHYGNVSALFYTLQADKNGLPQGTNRPEKVASGDFIHLGEIPEGFIPLEYHAIVDTEFNSATLDVGFKYKDGVDSTDLPQKDTGLFTLPTLTTKGDSVNGKLAPTPFPKTANLVLKAGAEIGKGEKAGVLTIILVGVLQGAL